jgi:hydroxyethylthiazole kinase-like uncharacterized protein yjeF
MMGAVTAEEMRTLEEVAFRAGATADGLMEVAGRGIGLAITREFPAGGTAIAYLGKGHNAGDAIVALGVLREAGWKVSVRAAYPETAWAELNRDKWAEMGEVVILNRIDLLEIHATPLVLLDGLLGIGSRGALREPLLELAREMKCLRDTRGARIVSVDVPSGLDPDTGAFDPDAVEADWTLMAGVPKRGLLLGAAAEKCGALELVPISELPVPPVGDIGMITPMALGAGRSPRPYDFHKGLAGRVSLIAGSRRYPGAAVLAASGALRGGAGLVTLHVPADAIEFIAGRCPPEVMLRELENPEDLLEFPHDCLVVGPGLGDVDERWFSSLRKLLEKTKAPGVLDADALNGFARYGGLDQLAERHVLTPHPGEFRRLAADLADHSRELAARTFADRHSPVLLLKGSRTIVTQRGQPLWCNPTGTPGMASGGQGDVLSGVIGALLAGGMSALDGAAMGAWLCGRASEVAVRSGAFSEETLLATDTLDHLGRAFGDWREGRR